MNDQNPNQIIETLDQAKSALIYSQRQMKVVWDYLSPNASNDMEWADEIIIAIEQKVQAAVVTQQPYGEQKQSCCPFCGSMEVFVVDQWHETGEYWVAGCNNPNCSLDVGRARVEGRTKEQAVRVWNTRYPMAATQQHQGVPVGWMLVPMTPTPHMVEAICDAHAGGEKWPKSYSPTARELRRERAYSGYLHALAAAPSLESQHGP
jgi:hypothetical protein